MKVLSNKSIYEIQHTEFSAITHPYRQIVVDLGTGSGRWAYKNAKENADCFYIGIDPAAENMQTYAAKAAKKPSKGGLSNVMYLVSSVESLPGEISHVADRIIVNLPWGSLRDGLIKAEPAVLHNLVRLGKPGTTVEIIITYSPLYEQGEMTRRELPALSAAYLSELKPLYGRFGLQMLKVSVLNNEQLKQLETDWAKKLAFGRPREVYRIQCQILDTGLTLQGDSNRPYAEELMTSAI